MGPCPNLARSNYAEFAAVDIGSLPRAPPSRRSAIPRDLRSLLSYSNINIPNLPSLVMVMPDGFAWNGQTYDSLSKVAFAITGTKWNGPRFFGLRDKEDSSATEARS